MREVVILYSGGLDSFTMREVAKTRPVETNYKYVYFDIGQEYAEKEIKSLPSDVQIHKVDWLKKDTELIAKEGSSSGNIIIPGRNATLANLAASIYTPDEIWMGALLGEMHDGSTDKNWGFVRKINELFHHVYAPFNKVPQVVFPLAHLGFNKLTATQWLIKQGITPETIMATSSCLKDSKIPCGRCVVCARRKGIFHQCGFAEEYETDPFLSKENLGMMLEMFSFEAGVTNSCHYDEHRRVEIVPAVRSLWGKNDEAILDVLLDWNSVYCPEISG